MRQKSSGSRSSLFLIELIFSLLVFALVSTVCIRFFAASWKNRTAAREWNRIQELTVNAAEILEAGDAQAEEFRMLFPEGHFSDSHAEMFFDAHWTPCEEEQAVYLLQLQLSSDTWSKGMELIFQKADGTLLYRQEIRFPHVTRQEAS